MDKTLDYLKDCAKQSTTILLLETISEKLVELNGEMNEAQLYKWLFLNGYVQGKIDILTQNK